jgi:rubrerythrin
MYPGFIKEAVAEGNRQAEISFKNANAVEEIHYGLYKKALDAVNAGKDLDSKPIWLCSVCGNTVEGTCPDQCPVCKASKDKFSEVK